MSLTRSEVETWILERGWDGMTYSDVSRAVVTNRRHRERSREARVELRAVLSDLRDAGVVSFGRATNERDGWRGSQIKINRQRAVEVEEAPVDQKTYGADHD